MHLHGIYSFTGWIFHISSPKNANLIVISWGNLKTTYNSLVPVPVLIGSIMEVMLTLSWQWTAWQQTVCKDIRRMWLAKMLNRQLLLHLPNRYGKIYISAKITLVTRLHSFLSPYPFYPQQTLDTPLWHKLHSSQNHIH